MGHHVNVVRRGSLVRALAGIGTAMLALPLIMLAAYAAVILAAVAFVVIVAVIVSHPFRTATPVATVRRADDPAVTAHQAAVRAALSR